MDSKKTPRLYNLDQEVLSVGFQQKHFIEGPLTDSGKCLLFLRILPGIPQGGSKSGVVNVLVDNQYFEKNFET